MLHEVRFKEHEKSELIRGLFPIVNRKSPHLAFKAIHADPSGKLTATDGVLLAEFTPENGKEIVPPGHWEIRKLTKASTQLEKTAEYNDSKLPETETIFSMMVGAEKVELPRYLRENRFSFFVWALARRTEQIFNMEMLKLAFPYVADTGEFMLADGEELVLADGEELVKRFVFAVREGSFRLVLCGMMAKMET